MSFCGGESSFDLFECGLRVFHPNGKRVATTVNAKQNLLQHLATDFETVGTRSVHDELCSKSNRSSPPQGHGGEGAGDGRSAGDSGVVRSADHSSPRSIQAQHDQELHMKMQQLLSIEEVEEDVQDDARHDEDECQKGNNDEEQQVRATFSQQESLNISLDSSLKYLSSQVEDDDIDLDFVEEYDNAFNEFLSKFPKFLMENPDLVHNLRIIKLQKMLEVMDREESAIRAQLDEVVQSKALTEQGWHEQLREAARKKSTRETHLQSYLGGIHYNTKCMEAQLTWHVICDSEARAKKEHILRQTLAEQQNVPIEKLDLLYLLPPGSNFDNIRDAMLAPAGDTLSSEQEKDLLQFQMDNAYLATEVGVLKKKLAYQKATSRKHSWVENSLIRIDDASSKKLKSRFQKRCKVPL